MEDSKKGKNVEAAKNEEAVATEATITTPETSDPVVASTASKTNKAAIAMASIALVLGAGGLALGWMGYNKTATPLTFLGSGTDGNSANFTEGSIAEVADKVSKSVVSIVTSTKSTNFFGQVQNSSAAGTGIIVTADGYILTNKHVIDGANKVTVVLDDGTIYENVEVAATDPLNDVAYLKIKDVSDLNYHSVSS